MFQFAQAIKTVRQTSLQAVSFLSRNNVTILWSLSKNRYMYITILVIFKTRGYAYNPLVDQIRCVLVAGTFVNCEGCCQAANQRSAVTAVTPRPPRRPQGNRQWIRVLRVEG